MATAALSRLLLDAFRALDREIVAALADRGVWDLRPSHASAIVLVDRGGTRLTELAARAGTTKQAALQAVEELERLGLVRRAADPSDARVRIVKLTARGLRLRAQTRRALASVESRARRRLGARRYEVLRGALVELMEEQE